MPLDLARLRTMDRAEIAWRAGTAARQAGERLRWSIARPTWDRRALARELATEGELTEARDALRRGRWNEAHESLVVRFVNAPQRFLIAPACRGPLARAVAPAFPSAAADARTRADRIAAGEYDLLGYRQLRCDGPDWHYDPVNGVRAPLAFSARVPFLDPSCGDHKVIWELNRHQHWLALGRAYWLSGDARYRALCLADLVGWMQANPPLTGINWASMLELALRSLSWIWALQLFAEPVERDEPPWLVDLLLGLVRQLRHVERNLSYYFSPNTHLLGEGLALYVAGRALPELRASPRWAATGRAILVAEIDRQIAADGGHAERSAHYHRYALDFYLMALAVARNSEDSPEAIGRFEAAAARLAFVCRLLADDRGRLPHLGDDDGGALAPICRRDPDDTRDSLAIAAALLQRPELRVGSIPEEAFWFLAHPALQPLLERAAAAPPAEPPSSAALPDTGYYVSRSAAGDHLVADAGAHGYLNAGHAHADALALTLEVHGNVLLIDPGTGCYTIDPIVRDRFRSTQLHNTVTIDDRSQSLPRGPFHWAHTASATAVRWRANAAFDYLDAWHDGYAPLVHRRHLFAVHGDVLIVADLIWSMPLRQAQGRPEPRRGAKASADRDGRSAKADFRSAKALAERSDHLAAAHWHLDPRWSADVHARRAILSASGERVELATPDGPIERFAGDQDSGLGWQAPIYGSIVPTTTLRIAKRATPPFWLVSVFGLNRDLPIQRVEYVPVWSEAGDLRAAAAVRIVRGASVDLFLFAHAANDDVVDAAGGPRRARVAPATWRVGEIETDAHALFCRLHDDGRLSRIALVDGSVFRAGGRRVSVALPRVAPDLSVDLVAARSREAVTEARLSGPGIGARIVVAGRELPIAVDRRASPRPGSVPVNE